MVAPYGIIKTSCMSVPWPDGKRFAFTIFDDPDAQSLEQSKIVYSLLGELGLLTTKGVWMLEPEVRNSGGETFASPAYRQHVLELVQNGFEAGYHSGAPGNLKRKSIVQSLDLYRQIFGHDPITMANHYNADAIYWGDARLTGMRRALYRAVTRGSKACFLGSLPESPWFWGDVCHDRIRFCRNFITRDIDTLGAFASMPYYDATKPFVRAWYGSSEGANYESFVSCIRESEQDRLEETGSACIMYTHFGHGFFTENMQLKSRFVQLMQRLASKNGWFVPVGVLLQYLEARRGVHRLTAPERAGMEWTWLLSKLRHGTS